MKLRGMSGLHFRPIQRSPLLGVGLSLMRRLPLQGEEIANKEAFRDAAYARPRKASSYLVLTNSQP